MDDNKSHFPALFCGQMVMIKGGGIPGRKQQSLHLL